jgi:glycosyltransferase involved in cell wall biosynthesis
VPAPDQPSTPDSTDRFRVLLAIKTLGPGGAERLLVDLVAAGNRRSFEYEVAYVLAAQDALVAELRAGGTPVHSLGATHNLDLRWLSSFRRLLVAGEFDIVHFHLPYTAALGRLVVATLPRARRPVTMYTEHSMWNKVAVLVKALNRSTVRRDRALVAVSQAAYDALPPALRSHARVVVHGVDLARSRAAADRRDATRAKVRAELGVPPEEVLVVTVANLRSEKGYDVLLDAAWRLAQRGVPVRFAAAGRGSQAEELAERHRQLGLGDRFTFLGHRNDALDLEVAADVFVLPSHQEGLPVALMEAASVGTAIVATAVGGVPQVVTDGVNGLVVPPGDPQALAAALERVISDPALRERLRRRAMADSSRYDIARAATEIEDIYTKVLATRP